MQATNLFKEFAEAILEGDMSIIEERMEPSMFLKMASKVVEAHKTLKEQGLELKV